MKNNKLALSAVSIAVSVMLAACGGGGGSGGENSAAAAPASGANSAAQTTTSANVPTPQYAASSAQLSMFDTINQQRQQCGFPALVENTTLDQAVQAHAAYIGLNNTVTDTEVSGNQGFTAASYVDRAVHFGYPGNISSLGVSAAYYTNSQLSEAAYGQQLVYEWLAGVYHIGIAVWPADTVGIGEYETAYNGSPIVWGSLMVANLSSTIGDTPRTFPCQGTTGVAFKGSTETPTPPNTSGPWGTPVALAVNPGNTIVLNSGTITDPSGNVTNLQLLDSANDPNKLIQAYEARAYPATPLAPNTVYSVTISGTVNGKAFSKGAFTFTTGNVAA